MSFGVDRVHFCGEDLCVWSPTSARGEEIGSFGTQACHGESGVESLIRQGVKFQTLVTEKFRDGGERVPLRSSRAAGEVRHKPPQCDKR
jgi:hypothetical protein